MAKGKKHRGTKADGPPKNKQVGEGEAFLIVQRRPESRALHSIARSRLRVAFVLPYDQ